MTLVPGAAGSTPRLSGHALRVTTRPLLAEVADIRPPDLVSAWALAALYCSRSIFPHSCWAASLPAPRRLLASMAALRSVGAPQTSLRGGTMSSINWPWAIILCRFSDISSEPQPPQYYSDLYTANGAGGIADYWRAVTCNTLDLTGSRVFGWFTMNHPSSDVGTL